MAALAKESLQTEDDLCSSSVVLSAGELRNIDYRFESERLKSFAKWPVWYMEPKKLAASGFYYLGVGDSVKCFECHVILCQWVEGDDPMEDHTRWSERCTFVRKLPCGNVPIGVDPSTVILPERGYDVCGIHNSQNNTLTSQLELLNIAESSSSCLGRTQRPLHSEYVSYDIRLQTFETWPESMPVTKENLAQAGFYYTGEGDQTCCYHCGGGIKDWEAADDPWETHAKWFPKCCYLLIVKGQEYVNKVTGQQVSSISTEEAFQMDLPNCITKVKQPSPLERTEGSLIENAPGPSHSTEENAIEGEGSSSTTVQACKGLCSMKQHGSKSDYDALMCKICYNEELSVVFLPCGHMVTCVKCAPEMTTCPVCRVPVTMFVRAFLS